MALITGASPEKSKGDPLQKRDGVRIRAFVRFFQRETLFYVIILCLKTFLVGDLSIFDDIFWENLKNLGLPLIFLGGALVLLASRVV